MKEKMCAGCGLSLSLTGKREAIAGGEAEYFACRNPACRLHGKQQGYRIAPKTGGGKSLPQSEETCRQRSDFVARRMKQRKV